MHQKYNIQIPNLYKLIIFNTNQDYNLERVNEIFTFLLPSRIPCKKPITFNDYYIDYIFNNNIHLFRFCSFCHE